jgi:hypothetical protein
MPPTELREPWLVAAWPGMGAVALLAADQLAKSLGAEQVEDVDFAEWFDVHAVSVEKGVFRTPKRPRHTLFTWRNPREGGRDLLVFLAEAQPEGRGWAFCEALLDRLQPYAPRRVITFAAMAAPHGPGTPAGVVVAATSQALLAELSDTRAMHLSDGEVGGLNGLFPAAASQRGLEGLCLLGEIPFFATSMPNPRAAIAVLEVFSALSGVPVDTSALAARARDVDRRMEALFERLRSAATPAAEESAAEEPEAATAPAGRAGLPETEREHLEHLFEATAADRSHALELKAELDRLGVYRQYEDRFLDLFKHAD